MQPRNPSSTLTQREAANLGRSISRLRKLRRTIRKLPPLDSVSQDKLDAVVHIIRSTTNVTEREIQALRASAR